jgi:hypothetical protein
VDLTMMWLMHHGFRRDLFAFVAAAAGTPVADRATWRALRRRWNEFASILHKHHTGEDAGLWPLLLQRVDAAGDAAGRATLEAMEAEHAEIDPLLESIAAGLARLATHADEDARAALEVRLVAARERLGHHLAHEERDAMALVQAHLVQADWDHLEETHFKAKVKPRDMLFSVPWVMHRLPAEVVRQLVGSRRELAVVWKVFLRPRFERRERAAFRYAA